MTEPSITHTGQRYEISVDGVRAGFADYVDAGNQRIFHHTETDPRFGGRGLATQLVAAALADARAAGRRIVPACSFVAAYADKHAEYRDLIDPVNPPPGAAADPEA